MAQGTSQGQGTPGGSQGRGRGQGRQGTVNTPMNRSNEGTVGLNVPNRIANEALRPVEYTDRPTGRL